MVCGSVTGAAELIHVSVPAVSRMLSHMEARLGFSLFERIRGRLKPTQEAKRLYPQVSIVFEGIGQVNDLANQLRLGRDGQLRLAASPNLGIHLLPLAMRQFHLAAPGVKIHLGTLTNEQLIAELLLGTIDLGISFQPIEHPALECEAICENPIVFACPADHRLASRSHIGVADIQDENLIGFPMKSAYGMLLGTLFAGHGPLPEPTFEVRFPHLASALVNAGVGVALIDAMSVRTSVWPGVVSIPLEPRQSSTVCAVHSGIEAPSRHVRSFIEELRDVTRT
jgi:DNA-binding transcriptional LysR family regulator